VGRAVGSRGGSRGGSRRRRWVVAAGVDRRRAPRREVGVACRWRDVPVIRCVLVVRHAP